MAKSQSPKKNPKKEKKDVLDPTLFPGEIAADGIILYIIVIFLIENALPLLFFCYLFSLRAGLMLSGAIIFYRQIK